MDREGSCGTQQGNRPRKFLRSVGQSRCPNASSSLSSWELGINEKTINTELQAKLASLVAQTVKDPPAMWKTQVRSKGQEDPLEKGMAAAATAAKSLQSCPTLCNPIDGSPPGSPVPGLLQARTLEWVAISFSNA